MKCSIAFAPLALTLIIAGCGGAVDEKGGGGGKAATGGATNRGGSMPTGGGAGASGAGGTTPGKPACNTNADCPEAGACPPCADGTCAELACVGGSCQFQCNATGGTCSAERESCANGEACCTGLECCAGVPVPPGNEYCGTICPKSDENMKRDFVSIDPHQILAKLSRLPVGTWSYRTESSTERHVGPMAQDFKRTFNVGSSDQTILQVDADGVAFAAIQALNARLEAVEEQNQKLQRQLDEQRQRCGR